MSRPPPYGASHQDPKYPSQIPPAGTYHHETYLPSGNGTNITAVGFEDNYVRRLFIRKVYAILTVQLVVTGAVIAAFQSIDALRDYVGPEGEREGLWLMYTTWGLFIVTYFMLVCPCCSFKRKYPANVVILCLMTLCLAVATGVIAVYYDTRVVLMAAGSTALVVLVVTGLTFWTKFDITQFWYIVMLAPLGMLLVWPFMLIFNTPVLHTVYCGLGVMVFTLYLAYDTKTIVGGGRHELGPDDWIIGVVELYVDIVQIFLYMLNIFGRSD